MKTEKLLLLLLPFCLTGCSSHPAGPETAAEELRAYVWETSSEKGEGRLWLDGTDFSYIIYTPEGEEETLLSGCYEADEKTLLLHTEQTGLLSMTYSLQGEHLLLTWEGQAFRLNKPESSAPEELPEGLRN